MLVIAGGFVCVKSEKVAMGRRNVPDCQELLRNMVLVKITLSDF